MYDVYDVYATEEDVNVLVHHRTDISMSMATIRFLLEALMIASHSGIPHKNINANVVFYTILFVQLILVFRNSHFFDPTSLNYNKMTI